MFKKTPQTPPGRHVRPIPARGSAVFSYHAKRAPQPGSVKNQPSQQDALKRRQQTSSFRRVRQILVFLVVAGILASTLVVSSDAAIVPSGDEKSQIFLRDLSAYHAGVRATIASSFLSRNKLTINVERLNSQLKKQFPELKAATVTLPLVGHRPTVYVEAAVPSMVLMTKGGKSFVLDADGRALLSGAQVSSKIKATLPVVADQSSLAIKSGQVALPSDSVVFIAEVHRQLAAKGLQIELMTLPSESSELDVKLSGSAYSIKFNLYGNAREETGVFLALKQQIEATGKQPKQYIDVRVDQRAYYQ